jgi:hypothetical protein
MKKSHKHFFLNAGKLERARRVLGAATERETVERALDAVIAEDERNREARARPTSDSLEVGLRFGTCTEFWRN